MIHTCRKCGEEIPESMAGLCDACYPYGDACDLAHQAAESLGCKPSELPRAMATDRAAAEDERRVIGDAH